MGGGTSVRKAGTALMRERRDSGTPTKSKSRPVYVAAGVTQQCATLEAAIGGRDALVAALLHAPYSKDLQYLLGVLGDPATRATPLAQLCAERGLTPGEVVEAYKAGEINRAQALATQKVGARLADVAEDTMRLSLPHEITCLECEGTGTVRGEKGTVGACQTCHGLGVHKAEGDLDHKKLALEMGKMLQKGGGIALNLTQNTGVFTGGSAGGALELLQTATDRILYGGGEDAVMEGEVAEADPPDPDLATLDTDWQGGDAP